MELKLNLNIQGDTYWTHYTNDSLSEEARVDVIRSLSSPLEKQQEGRSVSIREHQQKIWIQSCDWPFSVDWFLLSSTLNLINNEQHYLFSVLLIL